MRSPAGSTATTGSRASACGLGDAGGDRARGRDHDAGRRRSFQLALKVAIAVGAARRFVVGDPEIQLIDVLAGGLDRPARRRRAPRREGRGRASTRSAVDVARTAGSSSASRAASRGRRLVGVVDGLLAEVPPSAALAAGEALPDELARPWLLPAVYERLSTGRGEFLAELRPAYPVFVNFGGIDYDDDEARQREARRVRARRRSGSSPRYGGNVLQLTLGDKGAYLYGVFGTPFAHEDDAARACAAALELRDLEASTAARDIRIGITHGRLRSGTYGHERRRTFVCLGDAVNLVGAADVEGAARARSTSPSSSAALAGDGFAWDEARAAPAEGQGGPGRRVRAHRLVRAPARGGSIRYDAPDRRARRRARPRSAAASPTRSPGAGRIVGISAEAGMGKSRLIAEFVRDARRPRAARRVRRVPVVRDDARATSSGARSGATLLAVPGDAARAPSRSRRSSRRSREIDPALVPRAPLLDAVLGLSIPDTELTASFDAKLRKTSLENLLADCLRARAAHRAARARARGLPLARPALARPARRARARRRARAPCCSCSPTGPRPRCRRGSRSAQLPGLEELPLDDARARRRCRGRRAASSAQLVGDERERPRDRSSSSSSTARRATRSTPRSS